MVNDPRQAGANQSVSVLLELPEAREAVADVARLYIRECEDVYEVANEIIEALANLFRRDHST
jgi:hypothetical protein